MVTRGSQELTPVFFPGAMVQDSFVTCLQRPHRLSLLTVTGTDYNPSRPQRVRSAFSFHHVQRGGRDTEDGEEGSGDGDKERKTRQRNVRETEGKGGGSRRGPGREVNV